MSLPHRERPAVGEPAGLLILHHGRGTDAHDLLPLADALDPQRRLHVLAPRAPLSLPGQPGFHWYVVSRVGYPDPATFHAGRSALAAFHDEAWQQTGIEPERTVLGGFSQGAVMSYALGLSGDRPVPGGILALSGFIPTLPDWEPELASRAGLPVFIAHGRADPVIGVDFGRRAQETLRGLPVDFHESEAGHEIDLAHVPLARRWLATTLPAG